MNASAPPHMFPAKPQILSMSQENNQQTTNGEEKRKLHRRAVSNAGSPNAFRVNKAREQNKHKRFNSLVEFDIFSSPALSTDYRNRADSLASSITNTNGYNAYCPTEYSDYSYQNSNTLPVGFVDMAGGFSLNTSSQHGELYDHAQSNYDQQSQIFSTPQSMYPNYSEFNYNGNYEEGINIPLRCESASFEPIQYRPNSALLSEQVVDSEQTLHFRNESFDEKDESDDSEVLMCGWHGCGQSFEVNASLVKHVSDDHIGSGMASYLCQWEGCNRHMKPFAKRHKIQNHVRIHTGERPFACNLDGCPKKFSRQDGLNTHMKVLFY